MGIGGIKLKAWHLEMGQVVGIWYSRQQSKLVAGG